MSKYTVSKIVAIFFSLTTVVMFITVQTGTLFSFAGSVEAVVTLYLANVTLLVVSLLVFIWQRARRDMPKHLELQTLESYARLHSANSREELLLFLVSTDSIARLGRGADEMISITGQDGVDAVHLGSTIRLRSVAVDASDVTVEVMSIEGDSLTVRLIRA